MSYPQTPLMPRRHKIIFGVVSVVVGLLLVAAAHFIISGLREITKPKKISFSGEAYGTKVVVKNSGDVIVTANDPSVITIGGTVSDVAGCAHQSSSFSWTRKCSGTCEWKTPKIGDEERVKVTRLEICVDQPGKQRCKVLVQR